MAARPVPILRNWSAGDAVTGALMQVNVQQSQAWLLQKPGAFLRQTVSQTLTSASTWYALAMDTEDTDTDGFHSTVTNTSRFTVPTGLQGWYDVRCGVNIAGITDGNRLGCVPFVNGSGVLQTAVYSASSTAGVDLGLVWSGFVYLNAGDYLEARGWCTLAGQATVVSGAGQAFLQAIWASQ